MIFPIKLNSSELRQLNFVCSEIRDYVKLHNQGSFDINYIAPRIFSISPKITVASGNYYDCDGISVFAIKITNRLNAKIVINGENYNGIKFSRILNHLTNYFPV
jgi:hypothetical protein